jgi:hypothetical protein
VFFLEKKNQKTSTRLSRTRWATEAQKFLLLFSKRSASLGFLATRSQRYPQNQRLHDAIVAACCVAARARRAPMRWVIV